MDNNNEQINELISMLKEVKKSGHLNELKAQIQTALTYLEHDEQNTANDTIDLSVFENILAEDDTIILRKPQEIDRELFLTAEKENSHMRYMYEHEIFCKTMWEQHISDDSISYSIIRKDDNQYLGFCGINNLNASFDTANEISIELLSQYCHKGYGYRALSLFLPKTAKLSGIKTFSSMVEINNTASQALMEKLGFKPYRITKSRLCLEDDYPQEIDSRLIELAEKFHTEPNKLFGNVLEYRLSISNSQAEKP